VHIKDVTIRDARLRILPKDIKKIPLRFIIHDRHLNPAGMGVTLRYHAALTNP
jgi:hypothetical protein